VETDTRVEFFGGELFVARGWILDVVLAGASSKLCVQMVSPSEQNE
jgi:hypothetical protein